MRKKQKSQFYSIMFLLAFVIIMFGSALKAKGLVEGQRDTWLYFTPDNMQLDSLSGTASTKFTNKMYTGGFDQISSSLLPSFEESSWQTGEKVILPVKYTSVKNSLEGIRYNDDKFIAITSLDADDRWTGLRYNSILSVRYTFDLKKSIEDTGRKFKNAFIREIIYTEISGIEMFNTGPKSMQLEVYKPKSQDDPVFGWITVENTYNNITTSGVKRGVWVTQQQLSGGEFGGRKYVSIDGGINFRTIIKARSMYVDVNNTPDDDPDNGYFGQDRVYFVNQITIKVHYSAFGGRIIDTLDDSNVIMDIAYYISYLFDPATFPIYISVYCLMSSIFLVIGWKMGRKIEDKKIVGYKKWFGFFWAGIVMLVGLAILIGIIWSGFLTLPYEASILLSGFKSIGSQASSTLMFGILTSILLPIILTKVLPIIQNKRKV